MSEARARLSKLRSKTIRPVHAAPKLNQRRLFLENLERRELLATVTLDAVFRRTVVDDAPTNGTFDSIYTSFEFLRIGVTPTSGEERGIVEFDVSSLAGATINSATLSLYHNGITLPDYNANIAVNAYAGNGIAETSDAQLNSLQGSTTFSQGTSGNTALINVKPFLQSNATSGSGFAGFNLRDTTLLGGTIEISSFVSPSTFPMLTVDYTPGDFSLSASLVAGNLVINDDDGNPNNLSISNNGAGGIVISDPVRIFSGTGGIAGAQLSNGSRTLTVPVASIPGAIVINGGAGIDIATVDLTNALGKTLSFNGGNPTTNPGDKLLITGGMHGTATLNHTNASDGSVVLDTNTINYTGLEPVDITGTTITNLVINLPDTDDAVDDDTTLSISGTDLIVDSINGEHEDDSISLTGITSITVNGRKGDDKITLDKTLNAFAGTIAINGDEGDDVTTIDLSGGSFAAALEIKGGLQATAVGDKLVVESGAFTSATLGYSGLGSGNLLFDTSAITFTEIEQADYSTNTSSKLIIDLPDSDPSAGGPAGEDDDTKFSIDGGNNLVVESLNGKHQKDTFSLTGVTEITINGRQGDDKITLDTTFKAFTGTVVVNGGAGGDTLVTDLSGGTFASNVTFKGDAPAAAPGDRLLISGGSFVNVTLNHTNASDGSVVLDGKTISYEGLEPVDLTGTTITNLVINLPDTKDGTDDKTELKIVGTDLVVESLNGEHETDTINLSPFSSITVNGRKGNDTIILDATLLDMGDKITVNGGDDDDTLILNDASETTAHTYKLDGNLVGRTGKLITFADIAALVVNAGDKNDALTVAAPSTATVSTTFDGGADADSITFEDANGATARAYELDGTKVGRSGGLVTYANVTSIAIDAGSKNDTLALKAAPTLGTTVTFNGDKSGTVNADANTLDLTLFNPANVELDAASPTGFGGSVASGMTKVLEFTEVNKIDASLSKDDRLTNATGAMSEFVVNSDLDASNVKMNGGTLTFNRFDILEGGTLADKFFVQKTATIPDNVPIQLDGQDGPDIFEFGLTKSLDGLVRNITVLGGTGTNTIKIDDSLDVQANNYLLASAMGDSTISRDIFPAPNVGVISYKDISTATLLSNNLTSIFKVADRPTATTDIQAGTGNDLLDFTDFASGAKVALTTIANGNVTASDTGLPVLSYTSIENLIGSAAMGVKDVLIGLDVASDWTVNTSAAGAPPLVGQKNVYKQTAVAATVQFKEFEVLTGRSKVDNFSVQVTAGEDFELLGAAGADTFKIGDTTKLDGLNTLKVDGGADADVMTLLDSAQTSPMTYLLSPASSGIEFKLTAAMTTKAVQPAGPSFNVETINLEAGQASNGITVVDEGTVTGDYGTPPVVINLKHLIAPANKSTLYITDETDTADNKWTMNATTTVRDTPAVGSLTINFTGTALTSLELKGGTAKDTINITTISQPTTVDGHSGDDTITAGAGNFDVLSPGLTVRGGANDTALETRTIYRGGGTTDYIKFNAAKDTYAPGDTLNISDVSKTGLTKYEITNSTITRKTATSVTVNYGEFELVNFVAGSGISDIEVKLGGAFPDVLSLDGGTNAPLPDNRVHIIGTAGDDQITVGKAATPIVENNRSQIEVKNVARLWIEGDKGADVIHNRSDVPGLLDGDKSKNSATIDPMGGQNDILSSDAFSNATYSPVLLGGDGQDFLTTSNNATAGTTYLLGDYFVNNMVPFTAVMPAPTTSRIQIVDNGVAAPNTLFGEAGDRYSTTQSPSKRNKVLGRLDTWYKGKFALVGDPTATRLTVIEWLQAQLPYALTTTAVAKMIAPINKAVRDFVRNPGDPLNPVASHVTYQPKGKALPSKVPVVNTAPNVPYGNPILNGGEAVEEAEYFPVMMTNPFEATDVNLDGRITAFDALVIINELNKGGARPIDTSPGGEFSGDDAEPGDLVNLLDVNSDMTLTAMDALLVINKLNLGQTTYEMPEYYYGSYAEQNAADISEAAANAEFTAETAANGQATSLTDDALLALLAADLDSDETE